jgi:tetratricopeptide (TPR) repeat protein
LPDTTKDSLTMPDGMPHIDPEIVASRIAALLAEGRLGAVKPLLAALEKLAPEYPDLALLRAGYWCQMQDIPQALAVLGAAIDRQPANAGIWLRRAEICYAQADYANAAQNAAEAVLLAPGLARAKSVLGLALFQLAQFDAALACLSESFAADPTVDVGLALAALSPATAIDILQSAIAANPRLTLLQNTLTRRYLAEGNLGEAIRVARLICASGIADAQTHCLLSFSQMESADWDEAAASAERALSNAPESAWALRLAAALSARGSGRLDFAPPENAELEEQALISGRPIAPGAFRELIKAHKTTGPVLDLFCGTGLNAIAALGLNTGPWSGIDPGPARIERCRQHGIYATLTQSDPLQALAGAQYPIILLNEALAYQASPQPWLTAVQRCLAAGGVALAAIPTGGSGMSGHGVFTHPEAAIARHAAAAGLGFAPSASGILRHLEGLPVHGVIASFQPA